MYLKEDDTKSVLKQLHRFFKLSITANTLTWGIVCGNALAFSGQMGDNILNRHINFLAAGKTLLLCTEMNWSLTFLNLNK